LLRGIQSGSYVTGAGLM